jgi:hypothetical protein
LPTPCHHPKKGPVEEVELQCLRCKNHYINVEWTFKGIFYHSDRRGKSAGLTCHLRHRNYTSCFHYYTQKNLVVSNGGFDYRTSLKYPMTVYRTTSKKRTGSYTPSQLGLTMTGNGPANSIPSNQGTPAALNSTLNQQVTYNAFQPQLPRNVINNILSTEQQDNSDERVDEEEEFDGYQPFDDDEADRSNPLSTTSSTSS